MTIDVLLPDVPRSGEAGAVACGTAAYMQAMANDTTETTGRFDVAALAARLPETAKTMIADHYLTDRPAASVRVFRVYRETPAHYHETCDEYLYCLQGRGTFWMKDASDEAEFGPGQLLFFEKKTIHALPKILEGPLTFLSIDAPRRDPKDIVFVDPKDGTAADFMARNAEG